MSIVLLQGRNGKSFADITGAGQLKTFSVSEDLLQDQLVKGLSYYVSAGAVDWFGGTYDPNEYVFYELFNNTSGDLLITGAQFWCAPAHVTTPNYLETDDQYFRVNQWLSDTPYLNTSGSNSINNNLNRTSTNTLPTRDNGNSASRNSNAANMVATPGSIDPGYICGFYHAAGFGKSEMLPGGQGMIIGKSQSWIVSVKPVQNSSPTNHIMGCRASVIELKNVGV